MLNLIASTSDIVLDEGDLGAALGFLAVMGIIGLLLTVYWIMMLVNAIKTDEADFKAGSKVVWIILMVVTGALGALIYQFVGKPAKA